MSLANYIIICDGRINLQAAHNPTERIQAASRCATELVKFYGDRLTEADAKPISDLQHEMMEVMSGNRLAGTRETSFRGADEMVDEMFALLDALEQKMRY